MPSYARLHLYWFNVHHVTVLQTVVAWSRVSCPSPFPPHGLRVRHWRTWMSCIRLESCGSWLPQHPLVLTKWVNDVGQLNGWWLRVHVGRLIAFFADWWGYGSRRARWLVGCHGWPQTKPDAMKTSDRRLACVDDSARMHPKPHASNSCRPIPSCNAHH